MRGLPSWVVFPSPCNDRRFWGLFFRHLCYRLTELWKTDRCVQCDWGLKQGLYRLPHVPSTRPRPICRFSIISFHYTLMTRTASVAGSNRLRKSADTPEDCRGRTQWFEWISICIRSSSSTGGNNAHTTTSERH